MTARIGIVDDHPAMALGVSSIINVQSSLQVVATATTVAGLLDQDSRFDLILMDLNLDDGSLIAENVQKLSSTGAQVLAYTSGEQPRLVREAARAGVIGMVRKSESATVLLKTIVTALRGEPVPTPDWASALIGDHDFVSAKLSEREQEVLALYAAGETAERVAESLFISRDTVIDHVRRIRAKYSAVGREAPTKVDLFKRAVEDGLVEGE